MSFTTTDSGEIQLLKYMLNYAPADNARVHLYTNNITPAGSDTISNFTESVASGYGSISLTGTLWTLATLSGTSCATYARQTFSFTTSESVQGYYITNNNSSVLIWAEKFPALFSLPPAGGNVSLDIRLCQKDCTT
jgi:hypothetical protein